jgi:hypothetical protein
MVFTAAPLPCADEPPPFDAVTDRADYARRFVQALQDEGRGQLATPQVCAVLKGIVHRWLTPVFEHRRLSEVFVDLAVDPFGNAKFTVVFASEKEEKKFARLEPGFYALFNTALVGICKAQPRRLG